MIHSYLSVSDPSNDYYFNAIRKPIDIPDLEITDFQPKFGDIGSVIEIQGVDLSDQHRYYVGGVEALLEKIEEDKAYIKIPTRADSGPIEVHTAENFIFSTNEKWFHIPPVITTVIPLIVVIDESITITGKNFPPDPNNIEFYLLNKKLEIFNLSRTFAIVKTPNEIGEGQINIKFLGMDIFSTDIIKVRREVVLQDYVELATEAYWSTSIGEVKINTLGDYTDAAVQLRSDEKMEDGNFYSIILYCHPPNPSKRGLQGIYPVIDLPKGLLELRIEFGMLWSASPATEDIAKVDGVFFEFLFIEEQNGIEHVLLEKTLCIFDGLIEKYRIEVNNIAGKNGKLVMTIFPGRTSLRDDLGVIKSQLIKIG